LSKTRQPGNRGFTIIELLVALGILAVLAGLAILSFQPLLIKADGTKCLSHMRSIHAALGACVNDTGHWPQDPEPPDAVSVIDEQWWIDQLSPYGITEHVWQCPAIKRLARGSDELKNHRVHYLPADFDERPFSPFRYANQPWLMEIASVHSRGGNVCFPDGSIRGIYDIVPGLEK
jgi:prepilin-type N-terminal cleavage/methylation domain-containing protein/prepilin-type processing-associated H-X9-DG protein